MKTLFGIALSALALCVSAKDTTFQPVAGGTDRWSDSANWSQGLPEEGDTAKLSTQQTVRNVTVDADLTGGT